MNKCEKCGFLHYRTDPCRTPKKSTAALEAEVLGRQETASLALKRSKRSKAVSNGRSSALPVDTNSGRVENGRLPRCAPNKAVATTSAGTVGNEDRQPKFDKKAWMREYMREYMRRRRAK